MSVNRAIIVGNVSADPEIRATHGGDKVATFRMATSETWKDKETGERKEQTEWHTIVCFNQNIVPVIEQYVAKGSKVSVEGSIKTRKWEKDGVDRYSTEIVIGRFDGRLGLEGQSQGGGAQRSEDGYGTTREKPKGNSYGEATGKSERRMGDVIDDEIPF